MPGLGEPIQATQGEQGGEIQPPQQSNKTGVIVVIVILAAIAAIYFWQAKKPSPSEQPKENKQTTEATQPTGELKQEQTGEKTNAANNTFKVYFSKGGEDCNRVYPVERTLVAGQGKIASVLIQLFLGPTETEKAAGYSSFFSKETDYILHSVKVRQGIVYVNIKDIRDIIPNASSSCGSAQLLAQMREALQQFPEVNDFRVAINGDPKIFYEWLQIGCSDNLCDKTQFQGNGNFNKTTEKKVTGEKICEDKCGDGVCQEIVCLDSACPCAETAASCPQDCK